MRTVNKPQLNKIQKYLEQGLSVVAIAQKLGKSRKSVQHLVKYHKLSGVYYKDGMYIGNFIHKK